MVAVLYTNETTPQFFLVFNFPFPRPSGADGHHRGRGHVGRHCPYTNNIWCGSVQALLKYRSKTVKMQKIPIDSHSNENFISLFSAHRGPPTPKKGEDTSGTRVRLHANFGVYRPAGCREIVDRTKKTYSKTNTSPFALTSEWRVKIYWEGHRLCQTSHPACGEWTRSSLPHS